MALFIRPQVLLGNNRIHLMRQQGGALRQAAIFTGVLRALLYPRAHGLRHREDAIQGTGNTIIAPRASLLRPYCSYPHWDCHALAGGRSACQCNRRWTMNTGLGMSDYLSMLAIVAMLVSLWMH